jgi:2,5-diamino-6-(ribosylamino)-4(3H)-pyrimidinone 5'-phosphate reductase
MSLDGKISTGSSDDRDFDKDLPDIPGVAEGLYQYYELEEKTDLFSFNTGKVMAKVGWNEVRENITKIPVTFVIIDSQPHLTKFGIENLLKRCKGLIIVTTNTSHPALNIEDRNLEVIKFTDNIGFVELFTQLDSRRIERMTIQSGGDMNATLLRAGLINEISIVVAPVLIGGKDTPSLIGGQSLFELEALKTLELLEVKRLENDYLQLRYRVHNRTL